MCVWIRSFVTREHHSIISEAGYFIHIPFFLYGIVSMSICVWQLRYKIGASQLICTMAKVKGESNSQRKNYTGQCTWFTTERLMCRCSKYMLHKGPCLFMPLIMNVDQIFQADIFRYKARGAFVRWTLSCSYSALSFQILLLCAPIFSSLVSYYVWHVCNI